LCNVRVKTFFFKFSSNHTTHNTKSERRAQEPPRRQRRHVYFYMPLETQTGVGHSSKLATLSDIYALRIYRINPTAPYISRCMCGIDCSQQVGCEPAYTRYSFTCFCVCKHQSSLNYPRPLALPTLLQYDCATFTQYMTSPRPSLYMPYTIHYW